VNPIPLFIGALVLWGFGALDAAHQYPVVPVVQWTGAIILMSLGYSVRHKP